MYAAEIEGKRYTFDVRGVWCRNLIMRDRETGSLWQQATGEAIMGPLRGARLKLIGGAFGSWSSWRAEHPETRLGIEPDPPIVGRISHRRMNRLLRLTRRFRSPGSRLFDRRLDAHEEIVGIASAGASKAYPVRTIRELGVLNDEVGGTAVVLVCDPAADRVRAFTRRVGDRDVHLSLQRSLLVSADETEAWDQFGRPARGTSVRLQSVLADRQWWLGWSEFHPGTDVFRVPA